MKRNASIKVISLAKAGSHAKLHIEITVDSSGLANTEMTKLLCSICDGVLERLPSHPYVEFSPSMASVKLGSR